MAPVKVIKTVCTVPTCAKRLTFMEKTTCQCSKCQMYYCTLHRLAEAHTCKHNYKTDDVNKEKFIKENKCVGEKVIEI